MSEIVSVKIKHSNLFFEVDVKLTEDNTRKYLCLGECLKDYSPDVVAQINGVSQYEGIHIESLTSISTVMQFLESVRHRPVKLDSISLYMRDGSLGWLGDVGEFVIGNYKEKPVGKLFNTRSFFSTMQYQDYRIDIHFNPIEFDKDTFLIIPIPQCKKMSFQFSIGYTDIPFPFETVIN